jgi:hypothetical protein
LQLRHVSRDTTLDRDIHPCDKRYVIPSRRNHSHAAADSIDPCTGEGAPRINPVMAEGRAGI